MPLDRIEPVIKSDSNENANSPHEPEKEDDVSAFVPWRPNFEIIRYPSNRGNLEWWHVFFAVLAALFVFWLFQHLYRWYEFESALSDLSSDLHNAFPNLPKETVKSVPLVKPFVPALVGPYQLPLSPKYRIAGKTGTPGHSFYMATGGVGAYVMIPAQDCLVWLHTPYCKFHGYTVTTVSGTESDTP